MKNKISVHLPTVIFIALIVAFAVTIYVAEVLPANAATDTITPTPLPATMPAVETAPPTTTSIAVWGILILGVLLTVLLWPRNNAKPN